MKQKQQNETKVGKQKELRKNNNEIKENELAIEPGISSFQAKVPAIMSLGVGH